MPQSPHVQRECVAQVAGRILLAWRNGGSADLERELESMGQTTPENTLEMERMEVLAGVLESLGRGYGQRDGAVRLLEHLANS
jgi:hypothetical protein